ncbi:RHTO0S10e03136g1_1 [Rhodotorula toruloides]|uniref:RHTO0S10e03136g1_1 n=1 Tax=Rhodotorula toruloides TaxID=5286 RepID=A0A061B5Z1_RHOTO|nr:RHTO0S10e03136g1_1 [Rhodotorula toruloides]
MYRRISIAARDATNRDSPTYRLLTHLAFRPEFRPFIEEVALDFSRCDSYRLWCVSAALRELTSVRAFDIPADFVEIAKGRFWDVGFATRETLRRFTVRSNQAGEFNDWHIERARLLPQGELRLLGGRKSAGVHLSPIFPSDLAILDVEISICPSCFDRLTIDSEETLTHLSILVRADDFDLSALYNLRSLTIMSRAVSISSAGNFFAAVSATLASAAELDHLHAVALTCGSGERSLWPKWISRTPSMPLHTCLPTSLLSLDIADARFDYDDLIPLTNKRNLPSLRRIILSKGTLGSMIWPFDKCEPELIKSTVEGHAANRGVLVEWMAEA